MSKQQVICDSVGKYGCTEDECIHAVPHDENSECNQRCMNEERSCGGCVPCTHTSDQIMQLQCRIKSRAHVIRELTALVLTMAKKNEEDQLLLRRSFVEWIDAILPGEE